MRKHFLQLSWIASFAGLAACSSVSTKNASTVADSAGMSAAAISNASYVNLNTGEQLSLMRDTMAASGAGGSSFVYSDSHNPIEPDLLFVDVSSGDTLYGPSGTIVNNAITKSGDVWKLDETKVIREGDKVKVKNDSTKLKMSEEQMKVKTGDTKVKVDGNETKVKTPDSKEKVDETGQKKIKPQ